MDVSEAIDTRIEVRSYRDEAVDGETRREILDAGRLAPSGRTLQHWRFVLVADDDFGVVVCTDPTYDYHETDAGRAVTHMQLAAWEAGVGSCLYTVDDPRAREFLELPEDYDLTLVAAFGYPEEEVREIKDRKHASHVRSKQYARDRI
ncbi:MAG: nitroreductase family protein [Haloarculaceae archaeon]